MCLENLKNFKKQLELSGASAAQLAPIELAIELAMTYGDPASLGKRQKACFQEDFLEFCREIFVSLSAEECAIARESKMRAERLLCLI